MTTLSATLTWSSSLAASVAAHAGAVLLVMATLDPRPVEDQPRPKSELRIETQQVAQSQATAAAAEGQAAPQAPAKGAALAQGAVPVSRASASQPQAQRLAAATDRAEPAVQAAPPPRQTATASPPIAQTLAPAAPPATTRPAALPQIAAAPATVADQPRLAAALPAAPALAEAAPQSQPAAPAPADGEHVVAALAFSGADGQIDPASLKAISSFMRPGDAMAEADETRDALSSILGSVPCARLQAEFNPETGSLDLRGHVPEEALKGPVLAALQEQLGSAIKVNDGMLILPRPQCGALSGIADVGLPQSQDQLTNPRLIGDDAQARAYDYTQGQSLVLDLAAPDYDAYVYVDYFAADGSVIHLVPNETVPLKLRPAKSAMRVGAPDAGEPFLNITIGPPYGQEIAAAFAASEPLYDGLRPLSEPAGPYLEWLKGQVAAARAANPDFKGEWVYFFISTRE